jgi:Cu+-exporting ATPase
MKASTTEAVWALQEEDVRIVMLTGDNRRTAEVVAKKLGSDEIEALPNQKIERVPPSRVNEMILELADGHQCGRVATHSGRW